MDGKKNMKKGQEKKDGEDTKKHKWKQIEEKKNKKEGKNKDQEAVSSSWLAFERNRRRTSRESGFDSRKRIFFSSPQRSDGHWGLPNFLSNEKWKINRRGHEADNIPPSSAEENNVWSYASILPVPMVFNYAQGQV